MVALGEGREMMASAPRGWEAPSGGFWEQRGMAFYSFQVLIMQSLVDYQASSLYR